MDAIGRYDAKIILLSENVNEVQKTLGPDVMVDIEQILREKRISHLANISVKRL